MLLTRRRVVVDHRMQFLVVGRDGTDDGAPARRMKVREAHLKLGDEMEADGFRWYGASLRDDDGNMIGSFAVMDFPDRQSLDEWLAREPYVVGDVWRTIEIDNCAVLDPWKFSRSREFYESRQG
jgi:uncharacterized protein YciI